MFDKLPPQTQSQVKRLLLLNDFRAAKALYDAFLLHKKLENNQKS